jgi:hypothetical protein
MNKKTPKREWQNTDGVKTKDKTSLLLAASTLASLLVISSLGFAWAETDNSDVTIKASDDIKNNPTAMKILKNIELFKIRYAVLQHRQQLIDQQQKFIDEQRKMANEYLQNDLVGMDNLNNQNLPRNAYAVFVSKVDNNSTQNLFWDQFGFMEEKIAKANEVKNNLLKNGASIEEAWQAYNDALAIHKSDLVSANKNLNVKYHFADAKTQDLFNKYGRLQ